jgi:hypothetical protein
VHCAAAAQYRCHITTESACVDSGYCIHVTQKRKLQRMAVLATRTIAHVDVASILALCSYADTTVLLSSVRTVQSALHTVQQCCTTTQRSSGRWPTVQRVATTLC